MLSIYLRRNDIATDWLGWLVICESHVVCICGYMLACVFAFLMLMIWHRKVIWFDQRQNVFFSKNKCFTNTVGADTTYTYTYSYDIHIHISGFNLWHRKTHINPQRNRKMILDRAGIELSTSRLRQQLQLPVDQHVRFMSQKLCKKYDPMDLAEAALDNWQSVWNAHVFTTSDTATSRPFTNLWGVLSYVNGI